MSDRHNRRPKYVAAMQLEHPEIFALEAQRGIDGARVVAEREQAEREAAAEAERLAALEAAQLSLF